MTGRISPADLADWLENTLPYLDPASPEAVATEIARSFRVAHLRADRGPVRATRREIAQAVHETNTARTVEDGAALLAGRFAFARRPRPLPAPPTDTAVWHNEEGPDVHLTPNFDADGEPASVSVRLVDGTRSSPPGVLDTDGAVFVAHKLLMLSGARTHPAQVDEGRIEQIRGRFDDLPAGPWKLVPVGDFHERGLGETVAAAREDVPFLLGVIDRLAAELDLARERIDDLGLNLLAAQDMMDAAAAHAQETAADMAWVEAQRDRYRIAWTSARRRARRTRSATAGIDTLRRAARAAVYYVDGEGWFVRDPEDPVGEGHLTEFRVVDAIVDALLPLVSATTPAPQEMPPLPVPLHLPCGHTALPDPTDLRDDAHQTVTCPECGEQAPAADCTPTVDLDEIIARHGRASAHWYFRTVNGTEEIGSAERLQPVATLDGTTPQARADAGFLASAHSDVSALLALVHRLRSQRDLAIAHDRQPYPTAHAYQTLASALRGGAEGRRGWTEYHQLCARLADLLGITDPFLRDGKGIEAGVRALLGQTGAEEVDAYGRAMESNPQGRPVAECADGGEHCPHPWDDAHGQARHCPGLDAAGYPLPEAHGHVADEHRG